MSEQQRWAVMCSMTGCWGVARPEHAYREDDGLLACTEWESLHDTWAEAMRYADEQARMIAGIREEWRAEFQDAGGGWFIPDYRNTEWGDKEWAEAAAKNWRNDGFRVRLVCRRIFEPWEVTNE